MASVVNIWNEEAKKYIGLSVIKGEKGEKGETGERGLQGEKGQNGEPFKYQDFTPEQLEELKGEKGDKGERGYSGLVPKVDVIYSSQVNIYPNQMTQIAQLEGDINILLNGEITGYDNEWDFVISQGETAFNVILPNINWGLGIAPVFSKNTTTQCRLYKIKDVLCGEWVAV